MVVWQITGNEIGPNDCGADYFTTKAEALHRLRQYRSDEGGTGNLGSGPDKITVNNRRQLVRALQNAMGFGGN